MNNHSKVAIRRPIKNMIDVAMNRLVGMALKGLRVSLVYTEVYWGQGVTYINIQWYKGPSMSPVYNGL